MVKNIGKSIIKRNKITLFEKARKNVIYRMNNKGYVPKKSTLVKYNLLKELILKTRLK